MNYGKRFEIFVHILFQKVFSNRKSISNLDVHLMQSGTQGGRDVVLKFIDSNNAPWTIFIECKYYVTQKVSSDEILHKLEQVANRKLMPNHWILLAPEKGLDNEADDVIARLNSSHEIFCDVHRWDSGTHIDSINEMFKSVRDQADDDDDFKNRISSFDLWDSAAEQLTMVGDAVCNLKSQKNVQLSSLQLISEVLYQSRYKDIENRSLPFFSGHEIQWALLREPEEKRIDCQGQWRESFFSI